MIEQAIDSLLPDYVEFLRELVRCTSTNPPGEYGAIVRSLSRVMSGSGLEVELVPLPESEMERLQRPIPRASLIGRLKGDGTGPTIILTSHYDTVPAGDVSRWIVDPFSGELRDNRVFGRGACDSKGRLICYLLAVRALSRLYPRLAGGIVVAATPDEETLGEPGMGYLASSGHLAGDWALIEGNSDRLACAWSGVLWVRITTTGQSGHSALAEKGPNAISLIGRVIERVEAFGSELRTRPSAWDGIPSSTLRMSTIQGGTKINIIPETCTLDIDIRVAPGQDIDRVWCDLKNVLDGLPVSLEQVEAREPIVSPTGTPLVSALSRASERLLGSPLPICGMPAYTDAYWLVRAGIPTVSYGPGGPGCNIHGPNENMPVAELRCAAVVVSEALAELLI